MILSLFTTTPSCSRRSQSTPSFIKKGNVQGRPPQVSPTKFYNFAGPDWGGGPTKRHTKIPPPWGGGTDEVGGGDAIKSTTIYTFFFS